MALEAWPMTEPSMLLYVSLLAGSVRARDHDEADRVHLHTYASAVVNAALQHWASIWRP